MFFQLLITLAFGALGLLLAMPILACLIVLVRELYIYDTLGLRQRAIALATGDDGRLMLAEGVEPPPAREAPVEKAEPLLAA